MATASTCCGSDAGDGRDLHEAAPRGGLTPMQAMLLGPPRGRRRTPMSDLARQLHCDKSNLTGIVDALESAGLVERTTPPDDRRVRRLVTTPVGQAVRTRLDRRLREDNPLLARLDARSAAELQQSLEQMLRADAPGDDSCVQTRRVSRTTSLGRR
jgi:DNA-binding MarR family transcriptional regulator